MLLDPIRVEFVGHGQSARHRWKDSQEGSFCDSELPAESIVDNVAECWTAQLVPVTQFGRLSDVTEFFPFSAWSSLC